MDRRVVITGLGAVSGLGIGIAPLWNGLLEGRSALRRIARWDPSGFPCRLAAEALDFTSAKDFVPKTYRKAVKVMARDIELALAAARCAVEDAGLITRANLPDPAAPTTYPGTRMGCHIGAGLIAADTDELTQALATAVAGPFPTPHDPPNDLPASLSRADLPSLPHLDQRAWGNTPEGGGGMNNLPPLWLLKYLPNMLACHVTILHGAEGPSNTITCAEASGLLSIGESMRVIQRGDADLCFSGGAEAPINHMRILRMDLAGRLAHTADAADGAPFLRPYDPDAPGGLLGEGGGILILEEEAAAAARSARIYARLVGYGAAHSSPASFHLGPASLTGVGAAAAAEPLDDGLQYAIENALADANLSPAAIDAIIPHASGIPEVDAGEAAALRAVFGDHLASTPLITLTPHIGDCLASSGGLALAIGAMCLHQQQLPARLHGGSPAPGLDAGPAPARAPQRPLRHILIATGSLGGQNAAILLEAASPQTQ